MTPAAPCAPAAALLFLLLAACAAPPTIHYYRLEAMDGGGSAPATASTPVMAIGPLAFPDYLERPQMVRAGEGNGLHLDDFHRWAEPLDQAVPRVLALNLGAQVEDLVVVPGSRRRIDPAYRLVGSIHRLDPDASGGVELLVQWEIRGPDGVTLRPPRLDRYHAAEDRATYTPGAMAAAVSALLAEFSRDVAAALEALR